MNIGKLLDELRARDISLSFDGEKLRYRAPAGALTTTLREAIAQSREEIICRMRHYSASSTSSEQNKCTICIPDNWQDEQPRNGRIRTACRICGKFIGYRPV